MIPRRMFPVALAAIGLCLASQMDSREQPDGGMMPAQASDGFTPEDALRKRARLFDHLKDSRKVVNRFEPRSLAYVADLDKSCEAANDMLKDYVETLMALSDGGKRQAGIPGASDKELVGAGDAFLKLAWAYQQSRPSSMSPNESRVLKRLETNAVHLRRAFQHAYLARFHDRMPDGPLKTEADLLVEPWPRVSPKEAGVKGPTPEWLEDVYGRRLNLLRNLNQAVLVWRSEGPRDSSPRPEILDIVERDFHQLTLLDRLILRLQTDMQDRTDFQFDVVPRPADQLLDEINSWRHVSYYRQYRIARSIAAIDDMTAAELAMVDTRDLLRRQVLGGGDPPHPDVEGTPDFDVANPDAKSNWPLLNIVPRLRGWGELKEEVEHDFDAAERAAAASAGRQARSQARRAP